MTEFSPEFNTSHNLENSLKVAMANGFNKANTPYVISSQLFLDITSSITISSSLTNLESSQWIL